MPDWFQSTLAATPAFLWLYFGVGLPWSLTLLPRRDWHDRALVACLALAVAPLLLTAWLFLLGLVGQLTVVPAFAGTVVLALAGGWLAWRKRQPPREPAPPRQPLAFDEKLLIALIGIALALRWLGIAFWPFTAYDALWVYGYQGRLYTLLGAIPASIDYYPQFLPLQYTYAQLATGGIDDHAARAGLIFLHLGSVLAVYVLGANVFSRRVGIFAAALWALYPQVAQWSRFGDLEIPLTFLITTTAAFFLMAWTGREPRGRYAIIAGLVFGGALWTKPTAGGFVWGVLLLLVVELVHLRFDWRAWLPQFRLALTTALVAAPLGGVWYIRNILLGHNAIDFPPGFWVRLAGEIGRNGAEFGWFVLAGVMLLAYPLLMHRSRPHWLIAGGVGGLLVVGAALLPSIIAARPLTALEMIVLVAGTLLYGVTLLRYARRFAAESDRQTAWAVGAAVLIALPYFVTYFWSYSYHYRLAFPVVPLLLLPTALILARGFSCTRLARWSAVRRTAYAVALVALSLPGVVLALHDPKAGWNWLWSGALADDTAKYTSGNAALMNVVAGLQAYLDENDEPLVVIAPGVRQLPFFFPLEDIRTETRPTRLSELDGVTYFIESSPEGRGEYEAIPLSENQVLSALNRLDVMRPAWGMDDGTLRYQVYELYVDDRFTAPSIHVPPDGEIVFGDFVRFLGHDISGAEFWVGRRLFMHLYWEVLATPPEDYTIYIHLRDRDGNVQAAWDGPVARSDDGQRYYTTLVWEPGEYIVDARTLRLEDDAPLGDGYTLVIGFYNAATGQRVPVTHDGDPAGDGYTLGERISVVPVPPEER